MQPDGSSLVVEALGDPGPGVPLELGRLAARCPQAAEVGGEVSDGEVARYLWRALAEADRRHRAVDPSAGQVAPPEHACAKRAGALDVRCLQGHVHDVAGPAGDGCRRGQRRAQAPAVTERVDYPGVALTVG